MLVFVKVIDERSDDKVGECFDFIFDP